MRDYAKVAPTFWTGETGKKIRMLGRDAQVVALYLITCPGSNWIGLYYLPLPTLCHEVGISREAALGILRKFAEIDFAYYDPDREQAWVPGTAKFQIAEQLKPTDKRILGIVKDLKAHSETTFGADFYRRYKKAFCLPEMKVLASPLDGPPKPVAEAVAVAEAEAVAETEEIGAVRRPSPPSAQAEVPKTGETAVEAAKAKPDAKRGGKPNDYLPLPLEVEAEGPKAESSVEAPNPKAKPGPEILFDIYDQENKQLPQVKARSHDRMAKCRTRINQAVSDGCLEAYLRDFRAAVEKAQSTPFLCGDNDRGWRASFDWLVENHTNVYKVLEGRYDSVRHGGPNGGDKAVNQPGRNPRSGPKYDPRKAREMAGL